MTNQVPTLFIGIGGIGCQIAAQISDKIKNDEDKRHIRFIGIDTNVNDIEDRLGENHNMEIIQTSEDWSVDDYLTEHPQHNDWFPDEPVLKMRSMIDGAGQVRALSRMAFTASVEDHKFDRLFAAIREVREVSSSLHKDLVIVIVGSITGGTGAGMFIQLPFLIRQRLLHEAGANKYVIRGMFIGSDITSQVMDFEDNRHNVYVNAYACMKELNAFNIHHMMSDRMSENIRVDYYDHTDRKPSNVPYDYLYLFENSSRKGTTGNIQLPEMINYISDIAYSLLFTKVSNASRSIEDNQILGFIRNNALNRFAAAGICKMVFPVEDAQEYVTLYNVNELVKEDWMFLDTRFSQEYIVASENNDSGMDVSLPEVKDVYVIEFEKESQEIGKLLSKFASEAYDKGPKGEFISKAQAFVTKVETHINDLITKSPVEVSATACEVNNENMKTIDDARTEVDKVWSAMKAFAELAETMKREMPVGIANDYFPTSRADLDLKQTIKDSDICRVYDLLSDVHPVVARYLIYGVINLLEEKMSFYRSQLDGVSLLDYRDEDYYPKTTEEKETAANALNKISQKYDTGIWRTLGPIGTHAQEKDLKKLRILLSSISDAHVSTVKGYIENSIKLKVEELLSSRFKDLARKYEDFFKTIEENIENNDDRMEELASKEYPYGTKGVYCSKAAFDRMSQEFKVKNKATLKLTPETKKSVFDELIGIQLDEYANRKPGIIETAAERKKRINDSKTKMGNVFKNSIISTIRSSVEEKGDSTVNLSIMEALKKEFIIAPDNCKDEKEFVKKRLNDAFEIASPMITTTPNARTQYIKFFALHSNNSVQSNITSTNKYYIDSTKHSHVEVIINDDFEDNELVVVTLSYGYLIEHLVKYGPESNNAIEYNTRITNLINNTINNPDIEVNPHLNKYWHEEGFIPSLLPAQRKTDRKEHIEAFIMGLGFDWFKKAPYKDRKNEKGERIFKWEAGVKGQFRRIQKCGQNIGNNYSDLYDSILFNRLTKQFILKASMEKLKKFKGNNTSTYIADSLLDYELIQDLAQPDYKKLPAEMKYIENPNIFNVFISMYSVIPVDEWEELVNGFYQVLMDKIMFLLDNNIDMAENKIKEILVLIHDNSDLTKSAKSWDEATYKLNEIYESFMSKEYE